MKVDWAKLRSAIERGLHSAQRGEPGSVRVHCRAAEHMLKGAKDGVAKEILANVHHASTAIEVTHALECLQKAQALLNTVAGPATGSAPSQA